MKQNTISVFVQWCTLFFFKFSENTKLLRYKTLLPIKIGVEVPTLEDTFFPHDTVHVG